MKTFKVSSEKSYLKRVANVGKVLLHSVISIIFILYGIGFYGLTKSFKQQNEKDCNFYTGVTLFNMACLIATIWIIIKQFN